MNTHKRKTVIFSIACSVLSTIALAEIITDGSMGPASNLTGPNYQITPDLGQQAGNNLFHSFSYFNLYTGESAVFSGDNTIVNIISRVTGGEHSFIDGAIQSTIPSANLFFLNPAGVMFSHNASLDVGGSVYISTADQLHFPDGALFETQLTDNVSLSTAHPSAFGFLDNQNQPIVIEGAQLSVETGHRLGLSAGNIRVDGTPLGLALIGGDSAEVVLTAISDPGSITLSGDVNYINQVNSNVSEIQIVNNASIDTEGDYGGAVSIEGDNILINNSTIFSNTYGSSDGQGVDIAANNRLEIQASNIQSATVSSGDAGTLSLESPLLLLNNGSTLLTSTYGDGRGGTVVIEAENLTIENSSKIISQTNHSGNSGDIIVEVSDSFSLLGDPSVGLDTRISTSSMGEGNSGQIFINSNEHHMSGSFIDSLAFDQGNAGNIEITTDSFLMENGSQISTETTTNSTGGDIRLVAQSSISLENGADAPIPNGLYATSSGGGQGGSISITSTSLSLTNSNAYTYTTGDGDAGSVLIDVGDIVDLDNSNIWTSTLGSYTAGNAGSITVSSNEINAANDSRIHAISTSNGYGGSIDVTANSISLTQGGQISNEAFYQAPGTGNIDIACADSIFISGKNEPKNPNPGSDRVSTGIFTFTGDITIDTPEITLEKSGAVSARTHNDLNAGDINLNTDRLSLFSGAQINASSMGSSGYIGTGGAININATESILIDGRTGGRPSSVVSGTRSSGDAGNIMINSPLITIRNEGNINTSTGVFGTGSAGHIRINTHRLNLESQGGLLSSSVGYGDGGDIIVSALDSINILGGYISGEGFSDGQPGQIDISTPRLILNEGTIDTSSLGYRDAGNIVVNTQMLSMNSNSIIESRSVNRGINAGLISITTESTLEANDSTITTEAEQGSGGNIELNAHTINLINTPISATVAGGGGGGGNVLVNSTAIGAIENSDITASADQGIGGEIQLNAEIFLRSPDVDLDASSNVEGNDGTVAINAPELDLSGSVNTLSTDFIDIYALLSNPCIAASFKERSSLIISGGSGLALAPDDYLLGTSENILTTDNSTSTNFNFNSEGCIKASYQ